MASEDGVRLTHMDVKMMNVGWITHSNDPSNVRSWPRETDRRSVIPLYCTSPQTHRTLTITSPTKLLAAAEAATTMPHETMQKENHWRTSAERTGQSELACDRGGRPGRATDLRNWQFLEQVVLRKLADKDGEIETCLRKKIEEIIGHSLFERPRGKWGPTVNHESKWPGSKRSCQREREEVQSGEGTRLLTLLPDEFGVRNDAHDRLAKQNGKRGSQPTGATPLDDGT